MGITRSGRQTVLLTTAVVVIIGLAITLLVTSPQTSRTAGIARSAEAEPRPKTKISKLERKMSDDSVTYRAPAPAVATAAKPAPVVMEEVGSSNVSAADKVALLVGINKAPGSTPLEGSITDVKNMHDALLKFGFQAHNIEVLTEGSATRGAILGALDSLGNRSKDDGVAVFLLATHSGQSGGDLSFATGGGGRISRTELASRLGRVKGKLVSVLPTCYSAGYAVPGIVGANRIAVFSSSADDYTWQIGGAGSWLVLYMIDYGLLDGKSESTSVEGLFRWAKTEIAKVDRGRVPIINDGIPGDLHLGTITRPKRTAPAPKPQPKPASLPKPTPAPAEQSCSGLGGLLGGCD